MSACQSCRLNECDSWREPCLCCCHDSEYEAGFDDAEEGDDE